MRSPRVHVDGAPVLDVQLLQRALQRLGAPQRHRKAVRLELEAPAQDVARQAQHLRACKSALLTQLDGQPLHAGPGDFATPARRHLHAQKGAPFCKYKKLIPTSYSKVRHVFHPRIDPQRREARNVILVFPAWETENEGFLSSNVNRLPR